MAPNNNISSGQNGAKKEPTGPTHMPRRQCIPIIYTKGTHYDVGFDVVINSICL